MSASDILSAAFIVAERDEELELDVVLEGYINQDNGYQECCDALLITQQTEEGLASVIAGLESLDLVGTPTKDLQNIVNITTISVNAQMASFDQKLDLPTLEDDATDVIAIEGLVGGIGKMLKSIWGVIKKIISGLIKAIGKMISALGKLLGFTGKKIASGAKRLAAIPGFSTEAANYIVSDEKIVFSEENQDEMRSIVLGLAVSKQDGEMRRVAELPTAQGIKDGMDHVASMLFQVDTPYLMENYIKYTQAYLDSQTATEPGTLTEINSSIRDEMNTLSVADGTKASAAICGDPQWRAYSFTQFSTSATMGKTLPGGYGEVRTWGGRLMGDGVVRYNLGFGKVLMFSTDSVEMDLLGQAELYELVQHGMAFCKDNKGYDFKDQIKMVKHLEKTAERSSTNPQWEALINSNGSVEGAKDLFRFGSNAVANLAKYYGEVVKYHAKYVQVLGKYLELQVTTYEQLGRDTDFLMKK